MNIDIGIEAKKREEIATGLYRVLADSNRTGPTDFTQKVTSPRR
jgi:hypothetical protein